MRVKIKKLSETAKIPRRAHNNDSGYDVFVDYVEDCGVFIKVYTSIAIEPPLGWYCEGFARSSTYKRGLWLQNGVGIIDEGYRGEIMFIFYKAGNFKEFPKYGEAIGQLVFKPRYDVFFEEVDKLEDSQRGTGGFGSTSNQ